MMMYVTRGKKVIRDDGYVLVYCPEYPYAKNGKYVFEHRLVMANSLGRPLETNEVVHHINGNRQDNRIENLMLTTNSEHRKVHWKSAGKEEVERLTKISRERAEKIKKPRKLVPCACGCGTMIWNYTDHGRAKKYVQGHNQKGKSWRWKNSEQKQDRVR